ncbi:hypothetical protein PMZ80_008899 [Knufia obscura]|uniref:Uncharacterized protein n=2 Tax=Knufia TaxID=430999 RepID=A0AAN8I584_9EURO|nr:hypothetical protein PMZ80_008899 [Knufia obscura]KAK5955142.1 hypothetical protein OHC33_003821 [Knufia fluminis]
MEDPTEPVVISSSSPAPPTSTQKPKTKAKAKSKKTKADIEAELAEAQAEIEQLRAHATSFDAHMRQLEEKEMIIRNETQRLREAEDLLKWGLEQQEAVLHEAVEKGIELAHAVLEQRYILEQEFNQRWMVESQSSDSSEDEATSS